ncbi:DNA-binding transcriptional regulator IlvY [Alcanivorax balearicus MACL04]|uniref:DNA-binding transcriptional regulator IlvY n=1 Tax=Alloalcanivorax balearicus MACL04 TaxID=1177182 RepID=A0ABT2R4U4_9GAMM|nr:HTH-type transcriptional activator IlvY [Alloalcanivorax balearicus]MCU5784798.1 DNA-binding transcriptional regulator IlvY [Alloalcanivorax balearicus MACL04]
MDIRALEHFLTLAETLHFGRTSRLCHISPSALSRGIRQLEQDVGTTLLYRDNRRVSLTREGERFRDYARQAVSDWNTVRLALQDDQRVLRGELSLYCSVTASYSFLHDMLSSFRANFPRIEIKLHTGDPAQAEERVLSGTEDIAVGARPVQMPNGIAFHPVTRSALLFIAPASQPQLAERLSGKASSNAWREIPMILSEEGLARERTDRWFRDLGLRPQIYAQVSGNEAIVSMVSLGFGIGVVPQIVLDNSPLASRIRILDVQPRLEAYEVGLFALEKRLGEPLIDAFWNQQNPG